MKLLLFAPCEKILEDKHSNNISLISIMQEVVFVAPKELIPLPENAVVPQDWAIFSMWQREADERPEFDTKAIMLSPDNKTLLSTEMASLNFSNFSARSQRVMMQLKGFPVGYAGVCQIALMLKNKGEADFSEVARFPITINQQTADTPAVKKETI